MPQVLDTEAREAVETFLHELSVHYGTDPKDIHEFFEDLDWARKQRRAMATIGTRFAQTLIATASAGILFALWEGFKHFAGK